MSSEFVSSASSGTAKIELCWVPERPSYWDEDKERIIGGAEVGSFPPHLLARYREGPVLPGAWWHAELGGHVVGYGWMDVTWGDAEILLAVDPLERKRGVGNFILESLAAEARARGLCYIHNVVAPTHPRADAVSAWLARRGFLSSEDGRLLRALVRAN